MLLHQLPPTHITPILSLPMEEVNDLATDIPKPILRYRLGTPLLTLLKEPRMHLESRLNALLPHIQRCIRHKLICTPYYIHLKELANLLQILPVHRPGVPRMRVQLYRLTKLHYLLPIGCSVVH